MTPNYTVRIAGATLIASLTMSALADAKTRDEQGASAEIERGRYLVTIAGCNDCHTTDYALKAGEVDEAQWLTGSSVGFEGAWGTTYPSNLRLLVQKLTPSQWLTYVRRPMRPPMPWFSLRKMTDDDLLAMYGFIRSLGPAGTPAPAYEKPPKQQPVRAVRRWHAE